jgi:hypothetical protein
VTQANLETPTTTPERPTSETRSESAPASPPPNTPEPARKPPEVVNQILSQGLRMVGLPLTLAGVFRVIEDLEKKQKLADNLLAGLAVVFLIAWIAAFASVHRNPKRELLESVAGALFWFGLGVMVVLIGLMAFGV